MWCSKQVEKIDRISSQFNLSTNFILEVNLVIFLFFITKDILLQVEIPIMRITIIYTRLYSSENLIKENLISTLNFKNFNSYHN